MKIYKSTCIVYHPNYIKEQIAEVDSIQALNDIINKTKEHYARVMPAINEYGAENLNGIIVDFGSYSEFLYVDGITFNEYVRKDYKNG